MASTPYLAENGGLDLLGSLCRLLLVHAERLNVFPPPNFTAASCAACWSVRLVVWAASPRTPERSLSQPHSLGLSPFQI
jgi:hypothetical protein